MSDQLPPPPSNDIPPPYGSPPPGYVAYGGYGAVQGTFSRIGALTKWLVVLLGITLVVQAASLLVQFTLRDAAADFIENNISSGEFDDKIAIFVTVGLLAGIAAIAQIVVLIIWTFRMAKNAQVLGRQPQSFSPGSTIAVNLLGGCTLGILNFFMWRELWRASDPDTAPGDPSWKQRSVSALVPAHLAVTLAAAAAGIASGVTSFNAVRIGGSNKDFAESLDERLAVTLISGALAVAAMVIFLMLVRQLAARHMKATHESV